MHFEIETPSKMTAAGYILSSKGYPTKIIGHIDNWTYRSEKPLDEATIKELDKIGVTLYLKNNSIFS